MDFGSFGAGFGSFGSALGATPLRELDPYAVYAATDIMRSGEPIVQIRRASDNATQDMTEAEFYGSTYNTFISGTTGHISKIYNQVIGGSTASDTHLIQETASFQPTKAGSDKAFQFSTQLMYSGDISAISDRPDFDGDISMGARYAFGAIASASYVTPMFTYYNSNSGGTAFNFVPVHAAAHRQLTAQISGTAPPVEKVDADDFGTSQKTAEVSLTPATVNGKSILSVHTSNTARRATFGGVGTTDNTDDCGTITEPSTTAFGIGGWKVQSTQKAMSPTMNIACACIFDRGLSLADQLTLQGILDGLEV